MAPIFAHALNNSVVVLVEWRGCDNDGMLSAVGLTGGMENTVLLVASFIGTVVIFTIFRKYFLKKLFNLFLFQDFVIFSRWF